jgi:hypothetical protein
MPPRYPPSKPPNTSPFSSLRKNATGYHSACPVIATLRLSTMVCTMLRGSAAAKGSKTTQQQRREVLKQVIAAFRDIHRVIEEMVGEGDEVFSRLRGAWNSSRRILRRSCNGQADNRKGYDCRSRGGRKDGGQSHPNGRPWHDDSA